MKVTDGACSSGAARGKVRNENRDCFKCLYVLARDIILISVIRRNVRAGKDLHKPQGALVCAMER